MSIKDKILLKMPTNLNDLEKARYLYIELGKLVSFSTKFQNTNDIKFLNMMIKNVSIDKFNKNQVNCSMWSQLYSQLLNEVNIKNKIIDFGHKYVEFYINDKRWVADATYETYNDLARIQNDDQTLCFGPARLEFDGHSNNIILNKNVLDLLNNIDLKLGYNVDKKENIIELSLLGYGIEDKVIPGIDFPKKFILGKISNKKIYKLYRKNISKEMLEYDQNQSRKI